jgi:EAL domain-containing protein (putative c-di-GMP-specific phosphodiesterase class I)/GGDEF domain-containing protein
MIGSIVYVMGGTEYPFTHLMYIPIIIAAFTFSLKGALATALLGGFVLGPFMPLNVSQGIQQNTNSWVLRLTVFFIISLVVGYLFQRIKREHQMQIKKSYIYELTGYPNARKLRFDMNQMIDEQKSFSLMLFKITNIDQINRYIDYTIGEKSLLKAMELMECFVKRDAVYSIFIDEFAVALWNLDLKEATKAANAYLDCFKEPILIDGIPVNLIMKCGISNYPLHGKLGEDLLKNSGRALDQSEFRKHKLAIYKDSLANEFQAKYETLISLYEAIKSNRFTMVYQPIINLRNNEVERVEALLRWNNNKGLNPDEFIKIAEDAGIISEISRWVITHVIDQLREWKSEGIEIKVAINISSKDLSNDAIIKYTSSYMKQCDIDPSLIEFELTERAMIENECEIEYLMTKIRELGIRISLDDFGTGYNSLVQFISLPIDYLKIDKFFVDHIHNHDYSSMIRELIAMAHHLGREVIAEGVETVQQIEQLKKQNCDHVQGFYLSKPLLPEQLKEFIRSYKKVD